jgi:hypothetical protein
MSIGILLYLDLEFWEGTLKTLTPSLQENAKYFTTRSYLTLTEGWHLRKENIIYVGIDLHNETHTAVMLEYKVGRDYVW